MKKSIFRRVFRFSDIIEWEFCCTSNYTEFKQACFNHGQIAHSTDEIEGSSLFVPSIKYTWVFIPDKTDLQTVSHEVVHAACRVLDFYEINYNDGQEEILAYFIGAIFGKIYS